MYACNYSLILQYFVTRISSVNSRMQADSQTLYRSQYLTPLLSPGGISCLSSRSVAAKPGFGGTLRRENRTIACLKI